MTSKQARHAPVTPGLSLAGLCPGFDDPVQQSQQVFRHVLTALSEPGTLQMLAGSEAPEGLHGATYQICLALLDADTALWIEPCLETTALVSALRFHCGCRLVDDPARAAFALITPGFDGDLMQFAQGSHEYPDRSTTVIVHVAGFDGAADWTLSGPGIQGSRKVSIISLDPRWADMLAANHRRFPCGVDLLFTAGTGLMGLPRTTQVEVQPCT